MPFLLVHIRGLPARVVKIEGDPFTIGKHFSSHLLLEDVAVSRDHCEIVGGASGQFFLRDRGSRNGTFVAGHRVRKDMLLRDGMEIQVGQGRLVFALKPPPVEAPPQVEAPPPVEVQPVPQAPAGEQPAREERPGWDRDQVTPVELKRKIHGTLLERLELKHEDFDRQSSEELRRKTEEVIDAIITALRDEIPPGLAHADLVREIADEALGLGPLEALLADPEVDEIMVNGWDRVYVERGGKIYKTGLRFSSDQQVLNIIRRIVAPLGRRIDESSPMVDARLPDGSRVNAVIAPLALTGPTVTIRKFAAEPFTVEDMVAFGTLSAQMAGFLRLAVRYRQNIMISGGTGSGKTTLLNVVSCFIPSDERIVTVEDAAELNLPQEHVVSLEAKAPNIRGEGAIPIRKLVINSLRMRPDRIIVGECRGGEALDMLQAMNTGHDGSLTTLHANTTRDSLRRLETLVLMAGMDLPSRAVREQVASAINLIVHTARLSDGSRKVLQIDEVAGMEGEDTFVLQNLYIFRQRGFDDRGRVLGYHAATGTVPGFVDKLRERRVEVDMSVFEPSPEEHKAPAGRRPDGE